MQKNLEYYIYKTSFLEPSFCDDVIRQLQSIEFNEHQFYNPKTKEYAPRSGSQELSLSFDDIPSRKIMMDKLYSALQSYMDWLDFPWYAGWRGYTNMRYNKYEQNKKMALHCDHIHDLFDGERKGIPILSIIGALNDDYEGGELIMFEDKKIDLKQGELLIFPSNFLYPHKVEPVTKGTRYTFVNWVW